MKNLSMMITAIPASIGLVLVEHPLLAAIVMGWLTYKSLKGLRGRR